MPDIDLEPIVLYALHEPPRLADVDGTTQFVGAVPDRALPARLDRLADAEEDAIARTLDLLADDGLVRRTGTESTRGGTSRTLTDRGAAQAERLPVDVVAGLASRESTEEGDGGEWLTHFFMSYLR